MNQPRRPLDDAMFLLQTATASALATAGALDTATALAAALGGVIGVFPEPWRTRLRAEVARAVETVSDAVASGQGGDVKIRIDIGIATDDETADPALALPSTH